MSTDSKSEIKIKKSTHPPMRTWSQSASITYSLNNSNISELTDKISELNDKQKISELNDKIEILENSVCYATISKLYVYATISKLLNVLCK